MLFRAKTNLDEVPYSQLIVRIDGEISTTTFQSFLESCYFEKMEDISEDAGLIIHYQKQYSTASIETNLIKCLVPNIQSGFFLTWIRNWLDSEKAHYQILVEDGGIVFTTSGFTDYLRAMKPFLKQSLLESYQAAQKPSHIYLDDLTLPFLERVLNYQAPLLKVQIETVFNDCFKELLEEKKVESVGHLYKAVI